MNADDVGRQIKKALAILTAATVVLYLVMAGGGLWVWNNSNQNTDALCALRADLEVRVANSTQFLFDNPNGIPGITPKTVQTGIDGQRRTIKALSGLSC